METSNLITTILVLWWVEVTGLYTLYILFLMEDFYFGILFEDTRLFLMFFGSIIIAIIIFFLPIPRSDIISFLCLALTPLAIRQMRDEEIDLKEQSISKNKEEINNLNKYIEREGGDAGTLMRLAYLYKDIGDSENSLKIFKKARELTDEEIFSFTEIEIRELEEIINEKKSIKKRLFKLIKNTVKIYPIAIFLALILIISAILFWKYLDSFGNFVFYYFLSWNITMIVKKSQRQNFG